jgi:hypothetical protein
LVVLRAAAQKVDSLANFPFHRGHRAVVCTAYLARLAASDASADPDVVLRRSAVRFLVSSRELVRDFPWEEAETELQGARQAHRVPQPLVVQEKVLPLLEIPVVEQKALLVAVHQTLPLAVQLEKAAESVWPLAVSLPALLE